MNIKRWYAFLATKPCAACGEYKPVEIAHLAEMRSPKTFELMPRSHKTRAALSALPLCVEGHRSGDVNIHKEGEEGFWRIKGKTDKYAAQLILGYLGEYLALSKNRMRG